MYMYGNLGLLLSKGIEFTDHMDSFICIATPWMRRAISCSIITGRIPLTTKTEGRSCRNFHIMIVSGVSVHNEFVPTSF
jgi:hypothetical protein